MIAVTKRRLILFNFVTASVGARPAEDGHGTFAPDAIFLIFQGIDVKQLPAFVEQAVNLLAAARFEVMAGEFGDVELPEGQDFGHLAGDTFGDKASAMRFEFGY